MGTDNKTMPVEAAEVAEVTHDEDLVSTLASEAAVSASSSAIGKVIEIRYGIQSPFTVTMLFKFRNFIKFVFLASTTLDRSPVLAFCALGHVISKTSTQARPIYC